MVVLGWRPRKNPHVDDTPRDGSAALLLELSHWGEGGSRSHDQQHVGANANLPSVSVRRWKVVGMFENGVSDVAPGVRVRHRMALQCLHQSQCVFRQAPDPYSDHGAVVVVWCC